MSSPLERLLWEIPNVEYVYSTSSPGRALLVVRFQVGLDVERSLVKVQQKLQANANQIPSGVSLPLLKVRSIDDVPILALTFHSATQNHLMLRRLVSEVAARIKRVPEIAQARVIGGTRRSVQVQLDLAALAARSLTPRDVTAALAQANDRRDSGALTAHDASVMVQTGAFFEDARDVENTVLGVYQDLPVYLRDVASNG